MDPAGSNVAALHGWASRVASSIEEAINGAPGVNLPGLFYERHVATGKDKKGIVYTPSQVCKLVVERAMGPQLARLVELARDASERHDDDAVDDVVARLAAFSMLDPACGTGAFLAEALRLLDATWSEVARVTGRRAHGSLAGQVHGIDDDPLAVDVARFNVCIAAAGFSGGRCTVPSSSIAADASKNIVVGNAITDLGFQDPAKRFDAVVGNPPYVNYKKYLDRIDRRFLEENYRVFDGQADLSYYFFELHARLLKDGGTSGQVSSRYFMQASHAARLREFLAGHEITEIVDMNDCDVFGGLGIHPLLFFFRRGRTPPGHELVYRDVPALGTGGGDLDGAIAAAPAKRVVQSTLVAGGWCMLSPQELAVKVKFEVHPPLTDLGEVLGGAETGHDEAFARHVLVDGDGAFGVHGGKKYPIERELVHPWLKNGDIDAYHHVLGRWCVYVPPDIGEAEFRERYPGALAFLSCFKAGLEARDNGRIQVPWYAWRRPRNVKNLDAGAKVVVPYKAPRLRASVDTSHAYCSYDVTVFVPGARSPCLAYVVGVLNSAPVAWYFSTLGKRMGAIYEFYSGPLGKVRVPIPDGASEHEIARLVEQAESAARRLHGADDEAADKSLLRRELDGIQARIDELVLRLVGASRGDAALMLGSNGSHRK